MTDELVARPEGYGELLQTLKARIQTSQVKAVLAVNRELILLYWSIGRDILDRQERLGWGAKVLDHLAEDLKRAFPGVRGFSVRNLKYMRDLAREWPDVEIGQQLVAQLPWGHNIQLLQRVKNRSEREWYIRACVEQGWSRNVLAMQIKTGLYRRQGQAITNFERSLPAPQSDLAQQALKDPYQFDFLTLDGDAREREIEQGLMDHLQRFLVELGVGFAFVGRQVRLDVGDNEYILDLLFYHLKLRCYVVIELKSGSFKPEYAGKLNFYLSAVDDQLRHPDDAPSIGLLLCQEKDRLEAEYALRGMTQPMGVSEYELTEALPDELKGQLPTIEEIESELEG